MTQVRFEDLGLSEEMLARLAAIDYLFPTPVQIATIKHGLEGRDIVACAQTGTGKTAAFGIPMIERLKNGRHFRGLVLAPTRELAQQINDNFKMLSTGTDLKIVTVYGGMPISGNIAMVRACPDIVVATPGRLLDLQRRRALRLDGVEILVLDEADRMLDMGFADELDAILRSMYPERQTMLFSATMPAAVRELMRTGVRDPVMVEIAPHLVPMDSISQDVRILPEEEKYGALVSLLRDSPGTVLVFTRTKVRTDDIYRKLVRDGFPVATIHSGMQQENRNRALAGFRSGRFEVLIATDVASRGLDIDNIGHVVNYDLPQMAEDHIHRIGRTGRAGASGSATTFLTPQDQRKMGHDMAGALGFREEECEPIAQQAGQSRPRENTNRRGERRRRGGNRGRRGASVSSGD